MNDPRPPRVLLIDIGGVIAQDPRPVVIREIARQEHLNHRRFARAYYRIVARYAARRLLLRDMYTSLRQDFGLSLSYREFRDLVSDRTLVAFPDVLQELHRVKQSRRLRVVLASNIEQHVWSGLNRKFDVKSAAHRAVLSYRLGILKPRKAFFEEALRREHARPEEVLYLDDSPENVRMARTLGIRSRLVRSRGETVRILQRLKRGRL